MYAKMKTQNDYELSNKLSNYVQSLTCSEDLKEFSKHYGDVAF